jgi:hypothetical protein
MLQGRFRTPDEERLVSQWKKPEVSKQRLGYDQTTRQLTLRLENCHQQKRSHDGVREHNPPIDWEHFVSAAPACCSVKLRENLRQA